MRNKYYLLPMLFFFNAVLGQANRVKFTYDGAGNQTKRYVCINCLPKNAGSSADEEAQLAAENLLNDAADRNISFYPNPTAEMLYINWKNDQKYVVDNIEIHAMSGQLIKKIPTLSQVESTSINFLSLPQGYYNVILIYSNGDKKNLKVLKK